MIKQNNSKVVLSCPVFNIEETDVELANGDQHTYLYVHVPDGVGIIALNDQNEILLTKQCMASTNEHAWRLPMGDIEEGETPEQAAQRELREETGFAAKQWQYVTVDTLDSNWLKHTTHFFIARDLSPAPLDTTFYEEIDVTPTSIAKTKDMLAKQLFSFDVPRGLDAAIKMLEAE